MSLSSEERRAIVVELVSRPGHEQVRALVRDLLTRELGVASADVRFEQRVPEVHGRMDALLGRTVFEFKRDLRRERKDAEEQLTRYLSEREAATGERFVGIATDGAEFAPYELRKGQLVRLTSYQPDKDRPHDLTAWLDGAVALDTALPPDPETVRRELGRESLAYAIARGRLAEFWSGVQAEPSVRLKRQLWADLLERVYGSDVDSDDLFFQHTYLTIVAKTVATQVLGVALPPPEDLLSGKPFQDSGIAGAVESDFFDWPLEAEGSDDLIQRLAHQVARFRFERVQHDVLKGLYESLIDPEQRHDLGEYYTPDWLAAKVCDRAITRPLEQRVLDPACGSGTFLFHAVRRFLAAADAAGLSNREALARCCDRVLGVDVHPVAAIIARVTYLLALGEDRLAHHEALSIPVYLGDSLQWNTDHFMVGRRVLIQVPDGPLLEFPWTVSQNPTRFDAVIGMMLAAGERQRPEEALRAQLQRDGFEDAEITNLLQTYSHLRDLQAAGRDHIWGYIARNLVRPVWLSSLEQRADVLIGNPPWLSYRYMSKAMQERFRQECQRRGLWAGGKVATHQDLSAYFFARCVELYLRDSGVIAFVLPYAALNRLQFQGFRRGWFEGKGTFGGHVFASVRFTEAWALDETVQPLFPVPACVLFATPAPSGPLPRTVTAYSGTLPQRDATLAQADQVLQVREAPWPLAPEGRQEGDTRFSYRDAFRQGATMVPRMLCVVERGEAGRFGANPATPVVVSHHTNLAKPPWKTLPPVRGTVEASFLRPLYLGESIAPFRLLDPVLSVVPWDARAGTLLDSAAAERAGYPHLAAWLHQAETLWQQHRRSTMSLLERFDFYGNLSAQFPIAPLRIFYAASGSVPAAVIIQDNQAVAEHKLYWGAVRSLSEARYLEAILNSEALRSRIAQFQSKGQWGARDFDKTLFEAPIPRYDEKQSLHRDLAAAAAHAEEVASAVALPEGVHFVRARRMVRDALHQDGVAQEMDRLVTKLLGG